MQSGLAWSHAPPFQFGGPAGTVERVRVPDRHPLGCPRRARRVEDVGEVVFVARRLEQRTVVVEQVVPRAHLHAAARRAGGLRPGQRGVDDERQVGALDAGVLGHEDPVGEDRTRPAVGEHATDLGRREAWIERDGHPTGPVDGGVRGHPAQCVVHGGVDGDPVPGAHPGRRQPAPEPVGVCLPRGVGHLAAVDDPVGELVAVGGRHRRQRLIDQHSGSPDRQTGRRRRAR